MATAEHQQGKIPGQYYAVLFKMEAGPEKYWVGKYTGYDNYYIFDDGVAKGVADPPTPYYKGIKNKRTNKVALIGPLDEEDMKEFFHKNDNITYTIHKIEEMYRDYQTGKGAEREAAIGIMNLDTTSMDKTGGRYKKSRRRKSKKRTKKSKKRTRKFKKTRKYKKK